MGRKLLQSRAGKALYIIALVLLAAVFLFSAFMVWKNIYEARHSEKQFAQVEEKLALEKEKPAERYEAATAENADMIGWLAIEGTSLNYPVMHTPDRPNYYLRRGFDGKYSYYGTPYLAEQADPEKSDNLVIYGHHMNNKKMFAPLIGYQKKDFFEAHRYIRFDTLERAGTFEVVAAFKVKAEEFDYHSFCDAADAAEYDSYLQECRRRAFYETGVEASYGDQLITLSTCEYTMENGRFVVVAKRIK